MIKVFQRGERDCFRANLASLLSMKYENVPDFMDHQPPEEPYFSVEAIRRMDLWSKHHDFGVLRIPMPQLSAQEVMAWVKERQPKGTPFILAGLTKKGVEHSWVCLNGEVWHDPGRPTAQPPYAPFDYGQGVKLFYTFFITKTL